MCRLGGENKYEMGSGDELKYNCNKKGIEGKRATLRSHFAYKCV